MLKINICIYVYNVCVSTYNSLIKKKVECPKCNFTACRNCIEIYTKSKNDDFHCMNCKNGWDYDYFLKNMTQACVKRIMLHRKNVLLERERAKMPDTQIYANYHKEIEKDKNMVIQLSNTQVILDKSILMNVETINNKLIDLKNNPKYKDVVMKLIEEMNNETEELRKQKKKLYLETDIYRHKIYRWDTNLIMNNDDEKSKPVVDKVIMKCTQDDCKGFVMSNFKCGICETVYCDKCYNVHEERHICKKDDIKTAELIRKSTKACPNCAILIHKINGCSQMWCPSCKTTFNYNTGEIDKGIIHNPHYYEWYRNNKHLEGTSANQDQDNCNRNINQTQMMRHIAVAFGYNTPESNKLYYFNRLYGHLRYIIRDIPDVDITDVKYNLRHRIKWMLGDISDETFKNTILKEEKQHKYNVNVKHIYNMCQTLFNDVSHKVLRCNYKKEIVSLIDEYDKILEYTNNSLKSTGKLYGIRVKEIK